MYRAVRDVQMELNLRDRRGHAAHFAVDVLVPLAQR
jgi:hypothetical protein